MKRAAGLVYLSLLADVVFFFHKPLFSSQYIFPWDFRGVQLPLITFLADQLRAGHFPLWNPFNYCGYPVFANIEACFFQPLVLAGALVSAWTSAEHLPMLLEWVVVLQVWAAGVAAYHLFRETGTGRAAAWAGALIVQTGGYFASRAEHIGAMMAVAWMPLAWLAVFKLRQAWQPRWLAVLAAALGLAVVGGFPAATLAVFVSTVVLALVLVLLRLGRARLLLSTGAGCVLGIALGAVQFLPTAQLTQLSVAKYRADWLGAGGGLYWQSLVSLVLPNHYQIFDVSRFHGPGDITFLYLYSSLAGLALALLTPVLRRTRMVAALMVMLLFGALWMLGEHTVLWRLLYPLLPVTIRIGIHPEYVYGIFSLALAGLAAQGLDALRISGTARAAVGLVIAADLFLVGSGRPMNCASLRVEPGVTRRSFDGNLRVLDAVRRYVNQTNPPARIDTLDASLSWTTHAPITLIASANGVSPLALEHAIQLRLFLHDGYRWGWNYPLEKVDSPVLDLMNVQYVISSPRAAGKLRALSKFRDVETLPDGSELFENPAALPRFFLLHDMPRSPDALVLPRAADGTDAIQVLDYQADSLRLAVRSGSPAWLVMSENSYPGWQAWVDGAPAPIYRTEMAFRGVAIPGGAHQLRMEFHPVIFPVSLAISLVTAALLLVVVSRWAI